MDAYIVDAVRTPRGRGKIGRGSLTGVHPQDLLAQTLDALAERNGLEGSGVDDVVVGCVGQVGEQGANIARQAVLLSKLPESVSATTLNRYCGSGLQAVNFAAMGVMSGMQEVAIGGGVESMSRVPMDADGARGYGLNPRLREKHFQVPQGISADLIATQEEFSREQLDRYALQSQRRAAAAQEEGRFSRSLVPVRDAISGTALLERDEFPRPDTTLEKLLALPPSFDELGSSAASPGGESYDEIALRRYPDARPIRHLHTAGNSSGIADGAAAVLVASEAYARDRGLRLRARILSMATHAEDPVIMLTAPAETARRAVRKAAMGIGDVDLWEINEAFAAIPLQVIRRLRLDEARVNVNGGAIALGHPLGATGAILLGTVLDELERRDLSTALVTLCIAGGQGIATLLERV